MELGQGVRPPWSTVPSHLVAEIESWLGGAIDTVSEVRGGFTPTVAARISSGTRSLFVKVCEAGAHARSAAMFRDEIRIAAALPEIPQLAPLRHALDGDWIALAFDDLRGAPPPLPWSPADLAAVLDAIKVAHGALSPPPLPERTAAQALSTVFGLWSTLDGTEPGLDDWSRRHLPTLQHLEQDWPALDGDTLIHTDLRSDNIVLSPGRGPVIVDWPTACVGPRWLDLACFAPSVEAEGGPRCAQLTSGLGAPHDALLFAAVGIAGFYTVSALLPPPPGLPTVRAFQARQAVPARVWVAELLR